MNKAEMIEFLRSYQRPVEGGGTVADRDTLDLDMKTLFNLITLEIQGYGRPDARRILGPRETALQRLLARYTKLWGTQALEKARLGDTKWHQHPSSTKS